MADRSSGEGAGPDDDCGKTETPVHTDNTQTNSSHRLGDTSGLCTTTSSSVVADSTEGNKLPYASKPQSSSAEPSHTSGLENSTLASSLGNTSQLQCSSNVIRDEVSQSGFPCNETIASGTPVSDDGHLSSTPPHKKKSLAGNSSPPNTVDKDTPYDSYVTLSSSEGEEFAVDASVLSSRSGYFRSCLRSGMKESLTKSVQFANLTSSVLGSTVTFLKTSSCRVSLSTVKELLFAAAYLQISELQDYCCAFLTQELNLDTYSVIENIAQSHSLPGVLLSLNSFLCESISEFSATRLFKELSVDQLVDVLSSDRLNVVSEREVFDMVVLWMEANKEAIEQSKDIPGRLLSTVRIPCLYMNSHSEISTMLSSVLKNDGNVEDFLTRLNHYQDHPELCHELNSESNSGVRKGVEVIMTLGGLEQGIWKKQPSNKTKFALTSALPDTSDTDLDCPTEPFVLYDKHTSRLLTKVYEHCICTLDNYIYLVGGQTAEHDRAQFATSAVYRFDPRVFEWTELCPMNTCRSLFYLGCVKGKLYAAGGASQVGVENTVECYVPSTNQWTYMKPMLTKLHEHAGCVHGDRIFISGGHDGVNGTCSKLWCFCPDKDSWVEKASMSKARSNHAMVAMDNKLLAIGGCQCTDVTVEDVWECESYDTRSDQWTVVTSLPRLTSCLSAITVGELVLCFGGYTFSFNRYVDMVQVYNTENNSWKTYKLHMNVPKCLLCEKIVVNEVLLYAE